ncbi:MAG: hypothetical protein KC492_24650, partial [Myxococcales bacterium]|nr:hypothetical protein [Myxococcales bacterium]
MQLFVGAGLLVAQAAAKLGAYVLELDTCPAQRSEDRPWISLLADRGGQLVEVLKRAEIREALAADQGTQQSVRVEVARLMRIGRRGAVYEQTDPRRVAL